MSLCINKLAECKLSADQVRSSNKNVEDCRYWEVSIYCLMQTFPIMLLKHTELFF